MIHNRTIKTAQNDKNKNMIKGGTSNTYLEEQINEPKICSVKEENMSRTKKVIATMLMGVLVLGFAATAYAEENVMREPTHTHAFSVPSYSCYNSATGSTHPYVSGYEVDSKGNTTPVYSNCTTVVYYYKGLWKCACGATNGYDYKNEEVHTACGL